MFMIKNVALRNSSSLKRVTEVTNHTLFLVIIGLEDFIFNDKKGFFNNKHPLFFKFFLTFVEKIPNLNGLI